MNPEVGTDDRERIGSHPATPNGVVDSGAALPRVSEQLVIGQCDGAGQHFRPAISVERPAGKQPSGPTQPVNNGALVVLRLQIVRLDRRRLAGIGRPGADVTRLSGRICQTPSVMPGWRALSSEKLMMSM